MHDNIMLLLLLLFTKITKYFTFHINCHNFIYIFSTDQPVFKFLHPIFCIILCVVRLCISFHLNHYSVTIEYHFHHLFHPLFQFVYCFQKTLYVHYFTQIINGFTQIIRKVTQIVAVLNLLSPGPFLSINPHQCKKYT